MDPAAVDVLLTIQEQLADISAQISEIQVVLGYIVVVAMFTAGAVLGLNWSNVWRS